MRNILILVFLMVSTKIPLVNSEIWVRYFNFLMSVKNKPSVDITMNKNILKYLKNFESLLQL